MIKKICKICGKEFEAKSNRASYCSDECKKEAKRISKKGRNKRYYEKNKDYDYNKHNRENHDKANKWNNEKIEDLRGQLYELNDGYYSTLKINYQTKEIESAYGSKEGEKEYYKYDTKSKHCKKAWEEAKAKAKPLFP